MRSSSPLTILVCLLALLASMAMSTHHPQLKKVELKETVIAFTKPEPYKDPLLVAFYAKETHLKRPYRVIGKEIVPRYNPVGFKRQTAAVHDIMRRLAASIGGDAVINIHSDDEKFEGTVVSYQKVLA